MGMLLNELLHQFTVCFLSLCYLILNNIGTAFVFSLSGTLI